MLNYNEKKIDSTALADQHHYYNLKGKDNERQVCDFFIWTD